MSNTTEDKAALDLMNDLLKLSTAAAEFKQRLDNFGSVYGENNERYQKITQQAERLGNLTQVKYPFTGIY